MCCEDLNIGRRSISVEIVKTLAGGDEQLLPPDPNRIAIIFMGSTGAACAVSTLPLTANNDGIRVNNATVPLALNIFDHGDCVRQGWRCFGTAATRLHIMVTSVAGICDDNLSGVRTPKRQTLE